MPSGRVDEERRRATQAVIQTQIVLAVVGAVIMLVVGASLARAFGIVGAANLIRYRSKIDDPKDAVVMLGSLSVGLASGVGLYALTTFSTVFLVALLWVIESFEAESRKHFSLNIKAGDDTDALRPKVEADPQALPPRVRASRVVGRRALLRCAGAAGASNRPHLERHPPARPRRPCRCRMVREEDQDEVKLIIQPDDGIAPLVKAVRNAKRRVDILIFRFDRSELEKALEAAVARGVNVRALIAHTNRGGEKILRKLELRLLEAGVSVTRSADDLPRYHGKMMLVDDTLHVFGFNYTKLDIEKSRSFGVVTKDKRLVKEATALFEADCARQALFTVARPPRRQPRVVADRARGVHQEGAKAAPHLRHQGERPPDAPAARRARQGGGRDPHVRKGRQRGRRASSHESCRTCGCTSAPSSATDWRRSWAARA